MSVFFTPVWSISSGLLFHTSQGTTVDAHLSVVETCVLTALKGQYQVILGPSASLVVSVFVNDSEIGFEVDQSGHEITFQALPYDATLTITRTPQAQFTLLNGVLPEGLSLSTSGALTGTAAGIHPDNQTFPFTVRARNEFAVRDRAFAITVSGASTPALFNPATLPTLVSEISAGFSAYLLGTFDIAQSVWWSLDVIQKQFDIPSVTLKPVIGLRESQTVIDGLPDGLALSDLQVKGTIATDATPGLYVFELSIADPLQPTSLTFSLRVAPTVIPTIDVPLALDWVTPSGSLGAIKSFLPCSLAITASHNWGTIVYALSPYSDPLPDGLSLDATTGSILGVTGFVSASKTFTFIARATVGMAFVERSFSLDVSTTLSSVDAGAVTMVVDERQATRELAGLTAIITGDDLFHPSDPLFGFQAQPRVPIINGLGANTTISALIAKDDTAVGQQNFYYTIKLITGPLACTTVYDSFGVALYDVIVRTLVDPNAGAGGYSLDLNGMVVVQPVLDRDGPVLRQVYANSIGNIRYDLIARMGFAAPPATMHLGGSSSPELLEPWMGTSFQLAMPLAYLKPGLGITTLHALERSQAVAAPGNTLYFNKLFIKRASGNTFIPLQ